jgi:hypothetical protein
MLLLVIPILYCLFRLGFVSFWGKIHCIFLFNICLSYMIVVISTQSRGLVLESKRPSAGPRPGG